MAAFNVRLHGKQIDTVFFVHGASVEYVRLALVNHDGYDDEIKVTRARTTKGQREFAAQLGDGLADMLGL